MDISDNVQLLRKVFHIGNMVFILGPACGLATSQYAAPEYTVNPKTVLPVDFTKHVAKAGY